MQYILIDNYNILIRYAMALINDENINMHRYGGLLRFFMLLDYLHKQYPNAIIITFSDKCRNNFRKQLIDNYKGTRKSLPENVILQMKELDIYLQQHNIIHIYHDNYEADDLIASFTYTHAENEHIIVSTDKDLSQIIKSNIKIYNPFKRIYIDETDIYNKHQVPCKHFALYQALIGDASDNIAGIPGIGPKTAAQILKNTTDIICIRRQYTKYNFDNLEVYLQLTTLEYSIDLLHYEPQHQSHNFTNTIDELTKKIYSIGIEPIS